MAAASRRKTTMTPTRKQGECKRLLGGHAQPILGGAFWQEDDNGKDDGDK